VDECKPLAAGFAVDAGTTAEELGTAVSAVLSPGHIPAARLAVACADALADAAEYFKAEAKRKARALDDFTHLLKSARREVKAATTWEAAAAELGTEGAWRRAVHGGGGGKEAGAYTRSLFSSA
jgi:hypothetical protein